MTHTPEYEKTLEHTDELQGLNRDVALAVDKLLAG